MLASSSIWKHKVSILDHIIFADQDYTSKKEGPWFDLSLGKKTNKFAGSFLERIPLWRELENIFPVSF